MRIQVPSYTFPLFKIMIKDVLKTYKVLISGVENLPGASISTFFPKHETLSMLKKEMEWLETQTKNK